MICVILKKCNNNKFKLCSLVKYNDSEFIELIYSKEHCQIFFKCPSSAFRIHRENFGELSSRAWQMAA